MFFPLTCLKLPPPRGGSPHEEEWGLGHPSHLPHTRFGKGKAMEHCSRSRKWLQRQSTCIIGEKWPLFYQFFILSGIQDHIDGRVKLLEVRLVILVHLFPLCQIVHQHIKKTCDRFQLSMICSVLSSHVVSADPVMKPSCCPLLCLSSLLFQDKV